MTEPDILQLAAAPPFPNSRLPVLLYRGALPADPAAIEDAFAAAGWSNGWRNGIYRFHHFHSTAHEVLGIAAGRVTVRLGGPAGVEVVLAAGDVAVIPAGVAHFNAGDDGGLLVVGAYPGGARFDTLRGDPAEYDDAARRAAAVPVPERGPILDRGLVSGHDALRQHWAAPAHETAQAAPAHEAAQAAPAHETAQAAPAHETAQAAPAHETALRAPVG